jgi:hypothetical protein
MLPVANSMLTASIGLCVCKIQTIQVKVRARFVALPTVLNYYKVAPIRDGILCESEAQSTPRLPLGIATDSSLLGVSMCG